MYSPETLENERMSWRTVIYFNIVRSLHKILATLEIWDDIDDGSDSQSTLERQELAKDDLPILGKSHPSLQAFGSGASPTTPTSLAPPAASSARASAIAELRLRLLTLMSIEPQLADRLSGGISVAGSGKGEVFVRSGWQARSLLKGQKLMGRLSKRSDNTTAESPTAEQSVGRPRLSVSGSDADPLIEEIASMLYQSQNDIRTLWEHPVVRALISNRKLKLDEWSELYGSTICHSSSANPVF